MITVAFHVGRERQFVLVGLACAVISHSLAMNDTTDIGNRKVSGTRKLEVSNVAQS